MNLKSKNKKKKRFFYFNSFSFFRLWQRVTTAIKQNDQISATEEKTIIEDEQRKQIKERKATNTEWHPRLFNIDPNTKEWIYTYAE